MPTSPSFDFIWDAGTVVRSVATGTISTLSLTSSDAVYIANGGFTYLAGMAADSTGNIYLGDAAYVIWKVNPAGVVTRIAGTGVNGNTGNGGAATSAEIGIPYYLACDAAGNVYLTDKTRHYIRAVNMQSTTQVLCNVSIGAGNIAIVGGNGTSGDTGDSGSALSAEVTLNGGIALDASGNLYMTQYGSGTSSIRKITAATGVITTVVGSTSGFGGDGGAAASAQLNEPIAVTFDAAGNLYITDYDNNRVRVVNNQATTQTILNVSIGAGDINTVAGTGTLGYSGDGGQAVLAKLNGITFCTVDSLGNLLVADLNNRIRLVTTAGIINTVAGFGTSGTQSEGDGGPATSAEWPGSEQVSLCNFLASPILVPCVIVESQLDSIPPPTATSGDLCVRFRLRGFDGFVPRSTGLTATVTATLNLAGDGISQQILANSGISPPGSFYTVELWSNKRIVSSANYVFTTSVDLSTAVPI